MTTERPAEGTLDRVLALGKRRPAARSSSSSVEEEESEIVELEREVVELGRRILECRRTVPDALLRAFSSRLLDLRPPLTPPVQTLSLIDAETRASAASVEGNTDAEANRDMLEKLHGLKTKVAANAAAMPILLKRINECIVEIDKLEQCNVDIHSVFTRKR